MAGLPPALAKQYGPFNGITWIGIIGGGVVLAIVLRRSFGGVTPEAKEPTATDTDRLGLPGTTYHPPQSGGSDQPTPPSSLPIPIPSPRPAAPAKPVTQPVLPNPANPHNCPPGFHWSDIAGKCLQNAGPPPPPPPPKIPTPAQDIPGGFPADCTGVASLPPDFPGANVVAWIKASANPAQRSGKALGWSVGGQETPLTPGKLQAMKIAISSEGSWPLINAQRRGRGLRALSRQTFVALRNDVINQAKTGRDAFPDTFIQHLWDTYYMPYVCRNSPASSYVRLV